MVAVARAATTSDVFNAIAEPQRRDILVLLRGGERPVTELARDLGMTQPQASKHLRVLREVGLVRDRKAGKQRLYRLDARGLRPVHEWTGGFEQFWNESFDRLDAYVQDLKQARQDLNQAGQDLNQAGQDLKQAGQDLKQAGQDLKQAGQEGDDG
jgi:DNA-binding transcriptional ArsR family regulator